MGHVWTWKYCTVTLIAQQCMIGFFVTGTSLTIAMGPINATFHAPLKAGPTLAILNEDQDAG